MNNGSNKAQLHQMWEETEKFNNWFNQINRDYVAKYTSFL